MTLSRVSISASSKPPDLADWLELKALASDDGNSSLQDLVAELRRNGSTDAVDEWDASLDLRGETTERLGGDAFSEIEDRVDSADSGYPFEVGHQSIQVAPSIDDRTSTYLFLLLLSQFGVEAGKGIGVHPERDFEDIALESSKRYFGLNEESANDGDYLFGFPRRTKPPGFVDALDNLTRRLNEGGGARRGKVAASRKDAGLDVVVWRGFPDRRPGQMIAFGQCAAGRNWRGKINDLPEPVHWCRTWMLDTPAALPARMFFIPHRPEIEEWEIGAKLGGILFDRCRISLHAPVLPDAVQKRCEKWCSAVLKQRVMA